MSDIRLNNLILDRGIDTITYSRQEVVPAMPERGNALPPDIGTRAQLDLLLQTPSMDNRLDLALRPELQHRDLLLPGRFSEALGQALTQLRAAAAAAAESSDQSRVLNRAVRLLGEESNLRDLVQMYRSALYQG